MIRHATAAGLVIAGTRRMACGCEGRACAYLTKENKKKYDLFFFFFDDDDSRE